MADVPVLGFRKHWTQKLASLKSESHGTTNKYPEAAALVQQVYEVLSDTEILAGCTPATVRECSEWTTIVRSAEENRANFCKAVHDKPLFIPLYGMYMVTLNELKAVLKVCAQTTNKQTNSVALVRHRTIPT
jgi:hypothetical protein